MKNNPGSSLLAARIYAIVLCGLISAVSAGAQTRANQTAGQALLSRRAFPWSLMPASSLTPAGGANLPVVGNGTLGRLTKWTGFTSSTSTIGDTTIFEDKFGNVGIGTDSPTARLTVAGTIQATGTIQASGGSSVMHDATLTGNGTTSNPLGVAVPLNLTAAAPAVSANALINATNTAAGGNGIVGVGGDNDITGGRGLLGIGGNSSNSFGGSGVEGRGGSSNNSRGGVGLFGLGGFSNNHTSGEGVLALGGASDNAKGGAGVDASGGFGGSEGGVGVTTRGGNSCCASTGNGGNGITAEGGDGNGANHFGGDGIFAKAGSGFGGATDGRAGAFQGNVRVVGNLDVTGTKNFKIDHPLDPENKYLVHAAIESSEVLNVYSGNATTDAKGEATVTLPDWFEVLNRDFRYQLTVVGTFAQAIVAEKVKQHRFVIRTNAPNTEVSWQVTGVRSDAAMRKHPFTSEEEKPERERGTYLNPEAYDQPEERGIEWARNPETMRRAKERAEKRSREIQQAGNNNDR